MTRTCWLAVSSTVNFQFPLHLYSFLYHEFANGFQGFYTNRVSDEALRLSAARATVNGYMLNFTLRDKGQIEYDWDQTWTRAIPDQQAIADWIKRLTHFRAAVAPQYLIYGRMLRPWVVSGVSRRDLGLGKEPLVPSATWQSQDGGGKGHPQSKGLPGWGNHCVRKTTSQRFDR